MEKTNKNNNIPTFDTILVNGVEKKIKELTKEDYIYIDLDRRNDIVGELNKKDGIDCPICKNRGIVSYIQKDEQFNQMYIVAKKCDCMIKRKIILALNDCGINKETLERCTFTNFKSYDENSKKLKDKFIEYCNDIKNGNKYWLYIGAKSGIGKSHLCTATFQKLIKSGYDCEYMIWKDELPTLLTLQNSAYTDNQEKYIDRMNRLQKVDVLYIDDFFKILDSRYTNDSLSLAFKILDSRYRQNKITIISSEFLPSQLDQMDTSICGRIFEKANSGKYMITSNLENYRYRKGE